MSNLHIKQRLWVSALIFVLAIAGMAVFFQPTPTSAGAGTPPSMLTVETDDATPLGGDGMIDRIYVTYDEDINGTSVDNNDWTVAGYIVSNALESSPGIVTIFLQQKLTADTDAIPLVTEVGVVTDVELPLPSDSVGDQAIVADDGADPSMMTAETDDDDLNGEIDRLIITYSETLNADTVDVSDYALSGGYTIDGIWDVPGDQVILMVHESGSPDTGYMPTVTSLDDLDDRVQDIPTNQSPIGEVQASTDNAPPSIWSAETDDFVIDGQIDRIYVTYSEDLSAASVNRDGYDYSVDGYNVASASETSNGVVTLVLDASGTPDTAETPDFMATDNDDIGSADGRVADVPGNWSVVDELMDETADGAAPAPIDVNYDDFGWDDTDGMVDYVAIEFSEDVVGTWEDLDWTFTGGDINMDDEDFGQPLGDLFEFEVVSDPDETSSPSDAPTIKYTSGAGNPDSVTDAAGNPVVSFGEVDIEDNARPYLLAAEYYDGDPNDVLTYVYGATDGQVDTLVTYWTEEMDFWMPCFVGSYSLTSNDFNNMALTGGPGCTAEEDAANWAVYFQITADPWQTGVGGFGAEDEPTFEYGATLELRDVEGNDAFPNMVSVDDMASPMIYVGADSYTVDEGNGLVDELDISVTEEITGLGFGDFTIDGGGTYGSYSYWDWDYFDLDIKLFLDENDSEGAEYGDTDVQPEVTDLQGITDTSPNANVSTGDMIVLPDAAAPVICSRDEEGYCDQTNSHLFYDQDQDGNVDRAFVVFSEPIYDSSGGAPGGDEFAIFDDTYWDWPDFAGYFGTTVIDTDYDGRGLLIQLDEKTTWPDDERGDTGDDVVIILNDIGLDRIEDALTTPAYDGVMTFISLDDQARPAMGYAYYEDTDHNGYLDTLYLPFSESLSPSYDTSDIYVQDLAESYEYSIDGVSFYGAYEGELTYDYTLEWNLAERDVWDTGVTPFVRMSDVGIIEDMAGIDDLEWDPGEGNYAPSAFDYANPVIVDTTPNEGGSLRPTNADVTITFSEPMNEALLVHDMDYFFAPIPADFGGTTFNNSAVDGYTIMTVSFDEGWDDDEVVDLVFYATHARDLTTRPGDPNLLCENDLNPGCDGGTDYLMTFTAHNAGGGGGGGGGTMTSTTPLITLSSPTTGSTLTGGASKSVTWTLSGSGIDTVELRYSTNGGVSSTLIANNIAKAGPYAWSVPSTLSGNVTLYAYAVDTGKSVLDTDSVTLSVTSEVQAEEQAAEDSALGITRDAEGRRVAPGSGTYGPSPYSGSTEQISTVHSGWYIRAYNYDTVYLVTDSGGRRPFWDATTFMTWADDWDETVWVTDATLATMTLGAPMLPQPGVVLVKISSDPKVYMVEYDAENPNDYLLRWVTTETVASGMYGSAWADYIIDLEPTTMGRYNRGTDVTFIETVNTAIMRTRMYIAALVAGT